MAATGRGSDQSLPHPEAATCPREDAEPNWNAAAHRATNQSGTWACHQQGNVGSFTSDFHLSVKRCSNLVKSTWMPKNHTWRLNTSTSSLFYQKFERFRSKIIQATFSTAGIKAPQAELTDEEVLEAMQVCSSLELKACRELLRKHCTVLLSIWCFSIPLHISAFQKIINERIEFHQMLKQKGIKVPSLTNIDTFTSSPSISKGRRWVLQGSISCRKAWAVNSHHITPHLPFLCFQVVT